MERRPQEGLLLIGRRGKQAGPVCGPDLKHASGIHPVDAVRISVGQREAPSAPADVRPHQSIAVLAHGGFQFQPGSVVHRGAGVAGNQRQAAVLRQPDFTGIGNALIARVHGERVRQIRPPELRRAALLVEAVEVHHSQIGRDGPPVRQRPGPGALSQEVRVFHAAPGAGLRGIRQDPPLSRLRVVKAQGVLSQKGPPPAGNPLEVLKIRAQLLHLLPGPVDYKALFPAPGEIISALRVPRRRLGKGQEAPVPHPAGQLRLQHGPKAVLQQKGGSRFGGGLIRVRGQRPAVIRQRLLGLSRLVPAGALLGKISRQHQPVLIFRNPGAVGEYGHHRQHRAQQRKRSRGRSGGPPAPPPPVPLEQVVQAALQKRGGQLVILRLKRPQALPQGPAPDVHIQRLQLSSLPVGPQGLRDSRLRRPRGEENQDVFRASPVELLKLPDLLHAPLGVPGFLRTDGNQIAGPFQRLPKLTAQIAAGRQLRIVPKHPKALFALWQAVTFQQDLKALRQLRILPAVAVRDKRVVPPLPRVFAPFSHAHPPPLLLFPAVQVQLKKRPHAFPVLLPIRFRQLLIGT